MSTRKEKQYDTIPIRTIYALALILYFWVAFTFANDFSTEFDGGIIIPDRSDETLYIMAGGTSAAERNWGSTDSPKNMLWKMPLKNANGISSSEMSSYNDLWKGSTSINDVKRVIHNGKIHLVVVGNTGDAVAMYEFESKKCIYWSKTTAGGPHDVEYIPVGSGYIAVANPSGSDYVEVYDITKGNNKGRVSSVVHKGIHSVHWDGKQKCLWAWGSGQSALKNYKFDTSGSKPELKLIKSYKVEDDLFYVGTGHGGSPMLVTENGKQKRYLIFAGKSGIGKFDTETHKWTLLKQAEPDGDSWTGLYSNPKGVSHNTETGEVIFTKNSRSEIWSLDISGTRKMTGAELYKSRWWQHCEFSYYDDKVSSSFKNKNSSVPELSSKYSNGRIKLSMFLPVEMKADLFLFNSRGQKIIKLYQGTLKRGAHDLNMPHDLSSGLYFIRMIAGDIRTVSRFSVCGD